MCQLLCSVPRIQEGVTNIQWFSDYRDIIPSIYSKIFNKDLQVLCQICDYPSWSVYICC